jgi:hypothetical protein
MKDSFSPKERRGHRRVTMSFPVNLRINEKQGAYGLTIDASESGLLIQTLKDMALKTILNIEVVFPKGFELSNFKAVAEIIWKDICSWEDLEGYQYGLKFIQISDENYSMLKKLLGDPAFLKKVQLVESPEHDATLVVKVK